MLERRIARSRCECNIILLILDSIPVDALQALAERHTERIRVIDPVKVGFQLQCKRVELGAGGAFVDGSEAVDPLCQKGIRVLTATGAENLRHHAEEIVVPPMTAGCNSWMVVFQKSPHARESRQIFDLDRCQFPQLNSRTVVELLIGRRFHHRARRGLRDRLPVYEQLEIVDPCRAATRDQRAEVELAGIGIE